MLFRKQPRVAVLARREDAGPSAVQADVWAVLEQLTQDLPTTDQAADQMKLLLKAVRQSLQADIVLCCSGCGVEPTLSIGNEKMPANWCEDFAGRALQAVAQTNRDLLHFAEERLPQSHPADPQGLLMARLSKSRALWVMALRFSSTRPFAPSDAGALSLARQIFLNHRQHSRVYEKLKGTLVDTIGCLTAALDAKDPHARGHSERVARIAARLGSEMGLASRVIGDIHLAGLLHDIGKVSVADELLCKPDQLTPEEFAALQKHTISGDKIIASVQQLEHIRPGIRHHHERFDGRGYPDGLAGQQIPLLGRLLAVADACEAMSSDRPYRAALPPEQIDAILSAGAGTQWDPDIIAHFRACRREVYSMCRHGRDVLIPLASGGKGVGGHG